MKHSEYQSLTETARLVVEEAKNPHMKAAKAFLRSADDDESGAPLKRKHVLAAASAIAQHHSDWDHKKASDMGVAHYTDSLRHGHDTPAKNMAAASKNLGIHPDLHKALIGHMHDVYGKDAVENKYE